MKAAGWLLVLSCLVFTVACDADTPTAGGTGPSFPDGHGAVQVALESEGDVPVGLTARIRVSRNVGGSDAGLVAERESPIAGGVTLMEVVYVAPAVYDVQVDVLDASGAVVRAATAANVDVTAGVLTTVSLTLSMTTGGIQVVARLGDAGDEFEYVGALVPGTQVQYPAVLAGAQRNYSAFGSEHTDYLLLHRMDSSSTADYELYRATDPATVASSDLAALVRPGQLLSGLPASSECHTASLAALGQTIFFVCTYADFLEREAHVAVLAAEDPRPDGTGWRLEDEVVVPQDLGSADRRAQLHDCQLLYDDQANLFCTYEMSWTDSAGTPRQRACVFHAYSRGAGWSGLPSAAGEPTEPPVDCAVQWPDEGHGWGTGREDFQPFGTLRVVLSGGVYHMWLVAGAVLWHTTSTDRVHWRTPLPVTAFRRMEQYGREGGPFAIWALPGTPTRFRLVGTLEVEPPGMPDVYGIFYWDSVD